MVSQRSRSVCNPMEMGFTDSVQSLCVTLCNTNRRWGLLAAFKVCV